MSRWIFLYAQFFLSCFFAPHTDAWKSPINLTQESHERVKRSLSESSSGVADGHGDLTRAAKRPRLLQPNQPQSTATIEPIPAQIVCTRPLPDAEVAPRVMLSQVQDIEGLERVVV